MNHLPECGYTPEQLGFGGINSGIDSTQPFISGHPCICDRLRAREQRVREEWYEVQSETWEQGYKYALDAAREAVAKEAERGPLYSVRNSGDAQRGWDAMSRHALAAIDALREKP